MFCTKFKFKSPFFLIFSLLKFSIFQSETAAENIAISTGNVISNYMEPVYPGGYTHFVMTKTLT